MRTSFTSALDKSLKSDLIVTPTDQNGGGTLSPQIVPALEGIPGVGVASSLTQGDIRRDGKHGGVDNGLYGIQPATIGKVYKVTWVDGNDAALRGLNASGILLEKGEASSLHAKVGDRVILLSNSRKRATVTVRGIYKDDTLLQNGMITTILLHRLTDVNGVQTVLATVKPGSRPRQRREGRRESPRDEVPDRKAAVERPVQEVDRRPGQYAAGADLRPARCERADLAVRDRQHPAAVGATSARARSACCARSA